MLSIKGIVRENYDVAMSDKKEIEKIIKDLNRKLALWSEVVRTNKILPNKSYNISTDLNHSVAYSIIGRVKKIEVFLYNKKVAFIFTSDEENSTDGSITRHKNFNYIEIDAKINKDKVVFDENTIYHELQHLIDNKTKYKKKEITNIIPIDLGDDYDDDDYDKFEKSYEKYLANPKEFNAWFTSIIMPFLEKNKGIGFKEMIKKLYKGNRAFKNYFKFADKLTQQRFLKRAYKYHQEHNK